MVTGSRNAHKQLAVDVSNRISRHILKVVNEITICIGVVTTRSAYEGVLRWSSAFSF